MPLCRSSNFFLKDIVALLFLLALKMEAGDNGKEGLLVGSLFNLHGRKLSCITGCLLVGNPNSRGGAKETLLKGSLESGGTVLGEQGKHGSVQWAQKQRSQRWSVNASVTIKHAN